DRESVETLLREHAFRHSPFRALIGADLSPHDQQALANAAAMGRIPCGQDFLLMASQAALAAQWGKLGPNSAGGGPHPGAGGMPPTPYPTNQSINNLNLAELSSMMASNPAAMASLYFGNIPRQFMAAPGFPMMGPSPPTSQAGPPLPPTSTAVPTSQQQQQQSQQSLSPHHSLNSPPGGGGTGGHSTPVSMAGIHPAFMVPTSMGPMSVPGFPGAGGVVGGGIHPAAAASALYASRMQLNHLYQNLNKFHPYLQTPGNRFVSQFGVSGSNVYFDEEREPYGGRDGEWMAIYPLVSTACIPPYVLYTVLLN
ncbi:unnamed protein product, partial [Medioppia subpectinata]